MTKTFTPKLYFRWHQMKQRCYNPNNRGYKDYGGRGIGVCGRWRESYANFAADVGEPPTSAHTLERGDNDGDYEPGNVRWATRKEQANNRCTTILVTHNGETLPLNEWAVRFDLKYPTVWQRYNAGRRGADLFVTPNRAQRYR